MDHSSGLEAGHDIPHQSQVLHATGRPCANPMQYVACRGTLSQPMEAIQTMLRLNQAIASAVLHAMDNGKLERVCTLIDQTGSYLSCNLGCHRAYESDHDYNRKIPLGPERRKGCSTALLQLGTPPGDHSRFERESNICATYVGRHTFQ